MKHIIHLAVVIIVLTGLLGFPQGLVQATTTLFAAPNGEGTDCTEVVPCSIREAAAQAVDGSMIYLKEGTYAVPGGDEVAEFTKSVHIYGSCQFDSNPTNPMLCGVGESYRSVIDGQYTHRGLTLTGHPANFRNFYLYDLDIFYGNASEVDVSTCSVNLGYVLEGCGGGMFIDYANYVYLTGVNFIDNIAGAYNADRAGFGGGLYVQNSNTINITGSVFYDNTGTGSGMGYGGGVFATNIHEEMNIYQSEFTLNICTGSDSTNSRGCGIMVHSSKDVSVIGNYFSNNNPHSKAVKGSGVYFEDIEGFDSSHNSFTMHKGTSVLGAYNFTNTHPDTIDANKFVDNSALNLIQYEGKYWVKITNNFLIHRKTSSTQTAIQGGAAYTAINLSSNYASPLKSIANIYHNSISQADYGLQIGDNFFVYVYNNIIAYTKTMGIDLPLSPINLVSSFKTNMFYENSGGDGIMDPTSVYSVPGFVDLFSNLHILCSSKATDRGTVNLGILTDIDAKARPIGGFDIGADEVCGRFYLPVISR